MKPWVPFMMLGFAYVLLFAADHGKLADLRAKNDSLSAAEARLIAADAELSKQCSQLSAGNSALIAAARVTQLMDKAIQQVNAQLMARNDALEAANRELRAANPGSQVNAYFCGVLAGKRDPSGVTYDEPKTEPECRSIAAGLGVLVKVK
jgi:hypothetical protein